MKNGKKEKSIVFLIIIFIILAVTAGILAVSLKTDPIEQVLKNDQMLKLLIVLEDDDKVLATDVLLYYPVSRRVAVFDVPGNTGAIYASLGRVDRIDAVYLEKGIDAYCTEIEKMLGISIPFSLEINLNNFAALTDLLGGLRVLIPSPVDYEENGRRFLLPSGSSLLDGDKIRTYLEYALPDETAADVQERKQTAVLSLIAALNKNASQIFSKKSFPRYAEHFGSSLDRSGLYRLLSEISAIDAERLVPQTITGSLREVDGKILLFPFYDSQLIKDVCKQTMSALVASAETTYSRTYVLEIQNGTMVQGLARNTAALLQSVGYDVLSMTNADTQDYEKTVIIDHIGNADVVKSLGDFIRCSNFITDEIKHEDEGLEADSLVDFTIVLGKDFDGRYVR